MPPDAKKKSYGQIIRYIPRHDNIGAASTEWAGFCPLKDGGAGNGQYYRENKDGHKEGQVNEELVELKKPGEEIVHGKTTTTRYEARFTRAIFEIVFDESWPVKPSKENDWGLRQNPCWPQDIAPNDPGYVLLTDDHWYQTAALAQGVLGQRELYAEAPPKDMVEAAERRKAGKRPHSPDDPGPNKQPEKNPPSKRALELVEDGFAISDANVTRRLTAEEIKRDIEIIRCSDRTCSDERNTLGDTEDGVLIVSGEAPPMIPPSNVDSVPTSLPKATTLISRVNKRSPASHELPAATAAV